ncbi:MAG: YHS domain-containing protein [Fimbriimonadaceae bacterium]
MKSLLIFAALALIVCGCAPDATTEETTGSTKSIDGGLRTGNDGPATSPTEDDEGSGPVGADDEKVEGEPKAADTTAMDAPPAKGDMKPVAFTNGDGELICPVMKSVIKSENTAVGFHDHEGKRYYFCCDGCPEVFKKDPAKWAAN